MIEVSGNPGPERPKKCYVKYEVFEMLILLKLIRQDTEMKKREWTVVNTFIEKYSDYYSIEMVRCQF